MADNQLSEGKKSESVEKKLSQTPAAITGRKWKEETKGTDLVMKTREANKRKQKKYKEKIKGTDQEKKIREADNLYHLKRSSTRNLTSCVSYVLGGHEPKWEFQPISEENDTTNPNYLRLMEIFKNSAAESENSDENKPYYVQLYVSYVPTMNPDVGPLAQYDKVKSNSEFCFNLYVETSTDTRPCLCVDPRGREQNLVEMTKLLLSNKEMVAYYQTYIFDTKTSKENFRDANYFKYFWQNVSLMRMIHNPISDSVQFRMLNQTLTRKHGFQETLNAKDTQMAIKYGTQPRPLLPFPMLDLFNVKLPDQQPPFVKLETTSPNTIQKKRRIGNILAQQSTK